ncbi:hypothetical protein FBEOM_5320 [Fusarium beomiforme]|uniref:PPPDE domain-containing protein n=1 Tax=Fusarium beomiforme TaxID=44412 RepID=A0A9P5ALM0_9HYPO|nr:hypothetical protein FBEOM_5320 [Fusarium beomiforme]
MGLEALSKLASAGEAVYQNLSKKWEHKKRRQAEEAWLAKHAEEIRQRNEFLALIRSKITGDSSQEMAPLQCDPRETQRAVFLVTTPIAFGVLEVSQSSYKLLARHVGMSLNSVSHWAVCVIDRGLGKCYCYDLMSDRLELTMLGKNYFRVAVITPEFVDTWSSCYYIGETTKTHEEIQAIGQHHIGLNPRYKLLSNNCQHLVDSLVKELCNGKVISQAKLDEELSLASPKIARDLIIGRIRSKMDVGGESEDSPSIKEHLEAIKKILGHICEELNGSDLQQLSLTAKWLRQVAFRHLWRSVTIVPSSKNERRCINPYGPLQSCLQHTKELHSEPGVEADPKRCIHAYDWLGYMGNWTEKDPEQEDTWEAQGNSFGFEHGKLVRVNWNYISFIPSEIVEILNLKHRYIQTLSFVTDPFCSRFNRWTRNVDLNLSVFLNLRCLSWKAPMACHFDEIARLVQHNARQLEELDIELQSCSKDWENRDSEMIHRRDNPEEWDKTLASTMLTRQMFGHEANTLEASERACFPKLRSLKLTRVPLRDEIAGIEVTAESINLRSLRCLTLRMCPYWMPLLANSIECNATHQLESLEMLDFYLNSPRETATRKEKVILEFIGSFKGIRELSISTTGSTLALGFWEHVAGHASTLRIFIYHQRIPDQDEELLNARMGRDSSDLGISQEDRDRIRQYPGQNPLSKLNLEFIGLSCAPNYLKDIILPFVSKRSLKVLHIRHTEANSDLNPSGIFNQDLNLRNAEAESNSVPLNDTKNEHESLDTEDEGNPSLKIQESTTAVNERTEWKQRLLQQSFRNFVDWAFSPEGIRSLEYIAAGDFSHRNRYSEHDVLICRATTETNYLVIGQESDGPEWRDIKKP